MTIQAVADLALNEATEVNGQKFLTFLRKLMANDFFEEQFKTDLQELSAAVDLQFEVDMEERKKFYAKVSKDRSSCWHKAHCCCCCFEFLVPSHMRMPALY